MSISVIVTCEVDLADLPLEDHAVDVIASTNMNLEYAVPINFYPGEEAVLDKLPEDCSPGGCDDWEIDDFDSAKAACDMAFTAAPGLSVYELWQLINYIKADIDTYVESELFAEKALDAGNNKNNEEPDEPDYDPRDDVDYDEHMFDHLR